MVLHNVGCWQPRSPSLLLKAVYFAHSTGWASVHLFFVLSGFLITGILLDRSGPGALRAFWIRRALRIFPLYYAFLFVVTVVGPVVLQPGREFSGMNNRVWYWTYLCNWVQPSGRSIPALGHFWSLAVEEQFYLVWPLMVLSLDRRGLLRACLGLAALALCIRLGMRAWGASPAAVYEYTLARMDALTLGGAAAVVARSPGGLALARPYLRKTIAGVGLALLVVAAFTRGFNREDGLVQVVGYGLLSVLFAAFMLATLVTPRLAAALSHPWLRRLGQYSYAIYVFHHPILSALEPSFEPALRAPSAGVALGALLSLMAVVSALSLLAAIASWHLLERPALALKERWAPRAPTH